jgi:hypothetical protein
MREQIVAIMGSLTQHTTEGLMIAYHIGEEEWDECARNRRRMQLFLVIMYSKNGQCVWHRISVHIQLVVATELFYR